MGGGACLVFVYLVHPCGDALSGALHEGAAEGSVAAEAALLSQLLGDDGLSGCGQFLVAFDEVVDAQIINIGIIRDALTREILAEIGSVGAYGLCQLLQGEVVLQV